ncbi:unnamed protein product [Protopolystoma xenopodis]|uniref:Uncharacterized protein n=1 Tax=Protopolystoma xenopodis TaxID=117903 RepID=A0A448XLI4_9PLAT|nr:unnamed protein product [Protopolystoma xenopodis]
MPAAFTVVLPPMACSLVGHDLPPNPFRSTDIRCGGAWGGEASRGLESHTPLVASQLPQMRLGRTKMREDNADRRAYACWLAGGKGRLCEKIPRKYQPSSGLLIPRSPLRGSPRYRLLFGKAAAAAAATAAEKQARMLRTVGNLLSEQFVFIPRWVDVLINLITVATGFAMVGCRGLVNKKAFLLGIPSSSTSMICTTIRVQGVAQIEERSRHNIEIIQF